MALYRVHKMAFDDPRKFSPRIQWAQVLPVPDEDEPDGWKWRLKLQDQCYDLPIAQITGKRPPLPDQEVVQRRQCLLYNAYYPSVGPWFFGLLKKVCNTGPVLCSYVMELECLTLINMCNRYHFSSRAERHSRVDVQRSLVRSMPTVSDVNTCQTGIFCISPYALTFAFTSSLASVPT
jgi:hypothetical protein